MTTEFAPAERATFDIIADESSLILRCPLVGKLCNSVAESLLVLNQERQIVFCNDRFLDLTGIGDRSLLYGLRPGEALQCANAFKSLGGCGTSEYCRQCGAVIATIASQGGEADSRECSILRDRTGEALDLLVNSTTLELDGRHFTILAINDISDRKRRVALEKTFFHDILNTAGGILSLCELSEIEGASSDKDRLIGMIMRASTRLVEEINSQRDLLAAEMNALSVNREEVFSLSLLKDLAKSFSFELFSEKCEICVSSDSEEVAFETDRTLLSRVLTNMIKNACEASRPGDTVTAWCGKSGDHAEFWVRNPSVIPREVQLQLFKRSFSTKGTGRGLGTYSMKLLTERYLKGKIEFSSREGEGTVFRVFIPL
ncbi:MAG: HAMP domain-containing sensor histidine kinase [Syntrophobacter sp.]